MGALVTTLKAGMAFADWPSSDGHNMLLYPWFSDFASNPEKFVEHGHRLAGMLIGFVSIALGSQLGWKLGARLGEDVCPTAILIAVILQGSAGRRRVSVRSSNAGDDAQYHGCWLFLSLRHVSTVVFAQVVGMVGQQRRERLSPIGCRSCDAGTSWLWLGQYGLGGLLRHLHMMLNEHLIGAVIVAVWCSWLRCSVCFRRS